MSKTAMTLALEALKNYDGQTWEETQDAIKALEEALKQEQGDPVFWWNGGTQFATQKSKDWDTRTGGTTAFGCDIPLYTTPQPAQKPLTDEQMKENFETWHKETYVQSLEGYGDTYKNMHVRNRWQGWLAAHGIKENT